MHVKALKTEHVENIKKKGFQMKNTLHQLGQGMTEYIIIVALIAVAAIGVTRQFGGVISNQTAAIANEVAGQDGTQLVTDAGTDATDATNAAARDTNLGNYAGNNNN